MRKVSTAQIVTAVNSRLTLSSRRTTKMKTMILKPRMTPPTRSRRAPALREISDFTWREARKDFLRTG